jgi:dTDP-4-amino-4,6-dideoxygalactose transaminase
MVGCNSRLDTIQAAILRIKLRHLDSYCDARRAAADYYDHAFANNPKITTPFRATNAVHVFHQYTLKVSGADRNELQKQLANRGIPSMIYYPVPCHKQQMLEAYGTADNDLPVTNMLQDCVISLPIHTELTDEELSFITKNVLELIG